MSDAVEWIAVDWGTSNLRAWGMAADGGIAFSRASPEGMARLNREDYPEVLRRLLADTPPATEVLVCGMAGARQGWLEAPYLATPADLGTLRAAAVHPAGVPYEVSILPGAAVSTPHAEDVMRGEETQLLGLSALLPGFAGLVVMPGTHSKWGTLEGRRLTRFTSAMTGEVFEVLKTHSVLRHSLGGESEGPERDAGFAVGLDLGLDDPGKMLSLLFKVRSGSLLSGRSAPWCAGYLSGLLIGTEIGGLRNWITESEIPLIGGAGLCGLYARGFAALGARSRIVDATDATLAGLKAARQG